MSDRRKHSFNDWKRKGYFVKKGEKALEFDADGNALFCLDQVAKREKARMNSGQLRTKSDFFEDESCKGDHNDCAICDEQNYENSYSGFSGT